MFCPQCGQERISEATSFCSRCGYLLTGTADLLHAGGAPQQPPTKWWSPRSRGIRKGLFMFLLMFLFAPIVGLISEFGLGVEPWPVGVVVALLGGGGVLRMIYAVMFESKDPRSLPYGIGGRGLQAASSDFATSALPPKRDLTASEYTTPRSGGWIETETETREPASVTDTTTKLLEKDPES